MSYNPLLPTLASAAIGSGANGTVTTTASYSTPDVGNTFTIEVVEGVGNNVALSVVQVANDITVTLGTDGGGALDPAKNTATLVAQEINNEANAFAVASGTGASPLTAAEGPTTFTGGLQALYLAGFPTGSVMYVGADGGVRGVAGLTFTPGVGLAVSEVNPMSGETVAGIAVQGLATAGGIGVKGLATGASGKALVAVASGAATVAIEAIGAVFLNLPTADPAVAGQLWADVGVVKVSAG